MKFIWAVPPKDDDAPAAYVLFAVQLFALVIAGVMLLTYVLVYEINHSTEAAAHQTPTDLAND